MNHPKLTSMKTVVAKKLATLMLIACTAIASFATLGDGNKKSTSNRSLLSSKSFKAGSFSLRSGYTYRGNQVISTEISKKFINLNTTYTYQRGNTTFIVPLKKKVVLNNVKISLGNRQFHSN